MNLIMKIQKERINQLNNKNRQTKYRTVKKLKKIGILMWYEIHERTKKPILQGVKSKMESK